LLVAPSAHLSGVSSRIEDMSPPPLRLVAPPPRVEPPVRADRRPDAIARAGPRATDCPDPIPYADFLRRQNAIDRKTDDPRLPYADFLRSRAAQAPDRAGAASGPRRWGLASADEASPARKGPRLADVGPLRAVRSELQVRATYRVEVPLTSGRLIDIIW
jgi:hypothetical protein